MANKVYQLQQQKRFITSHSPLGWSKFLLGKIKFNLQQLVDLVLLYNPQEYIKEEEEER